ncbi:thiol reductant ABC exporter subunit CydC [Conexibacter sp. CPCC 206217]|uniref:thiol reductant ABC exporter subunit CydC n=1 Tax=Conexibacter sp. CPCC 206217 TaxID=3064574 RepID=UPI002727659E|nr:thiol reductant ABC exporter subunit CydC [Conexibacter sp. CPCC 206217]MDO8209038.1 thiol reductant ABC exporter subunit CydC [Conexibacter sp. CPCC 206217]
MSVATADAADLRRRTRVVVLGSAAAIAGAVLLAASGWLVTRAAQRPPVLALLAAIVVVRALGLVRAFGRYGERLAAHDLAFRQLAELRVRWYRRLVAEPGRDRRGATALPAADLLSRFVVDVDELQHRDVRVRQPLVVAGAAAAVTTVLAAVILPAAGLVLGGGMLIAGTVVPALAYLAARGELRRQGDARAALVDELVEAIDAAPQLALAGRAGERLARIDRASAELTRIGRRDAAAAALAQGLGTLLAGAALIGTLLVAVGPARDGSLDPVWLGALALLALGAFEAIAALPEAATRAVSVAAAQRRLDEAVGEQADGGRSEGSLLYSDSRSSLLPETGRTDAAPVGAVLRARGVAHRPGGPGAALVLDGIDLELAPGERIAVIGASGAGKTVLVQLLAGLVRPDVGEIALGAGRLDSLDPAAVRAHVRLAGQEAHLFATSIANNVRIGAPGASDEAVDRALRASGLGGWLDALPDGAATLVGEEGFAVSGGQRQRIALARCLVSPARLLLLDEPTAMLDPPAARAFLSDLATAASDRGVLVITHERIGLDGFDAVYELRDGRLRRMTR